MVSIRLFRGDITKMAVDAIVNAANTSLLGGGGVDGAIHRAGGPEVLEACQAIRARQGGCKVGAAVWTPAGRMPAQFVIHTVGPVYRAEAHEECSALLASCYRNSLRLADELGCTSIAFPGISSGIYGFPKGPASEIALAAVNDMDGLVSVREVIFVCFDDESLGIFEDLGVTTT